MGIGRKAAIAFFVGLAAFTAIWLNASGEGLAHIDRIAEAPPVACNIGDPLSSCVVRQQGCAAGGLFIWDPH
jgi:hypothetical protein